MTEAAAPATLAALVNGPHVPAGPNRFCFDDEPITAAPGDSFSLAMLRTGIVATSRSIKYRRRRGPYCLTGDCGTCLVRIDGLPNVRACTKAARDGAVVRPQNVLGPDGLDPTGLMDGFLPAGMDHHHFVVRPRIANQIMQSVARRLAGLGELPSRIPPAAVVSRHAPQVLVIGAGPAGIAATQSLQEAGIDVLCMERDEIRDEQDAHVLLGTAVFGAYPTEGVWGAVARGQCEVLHVVRAGAVVVATGARDPMIPFPNNDLPGIVSARGLLRQVRRSDGAALRPAVVVGDGPDAAHLSAAFDCDRVGASEVLNAWGHIRFEALQLRDRRIEGNLAALAPAPAPAHELAVQAGAEASWNGAGFAIVRDDVGRCRSNGPWSLWACGDVCGYMGPDAAADDGRRIATGVIQSLSRKRHA